MLLRKTNRYAVITIFLSLYLTALPTPSYLKSNQQANQSDQLIVSIANLSGYLCVLDTLNLHSCSITRGSPPTVLPNLSERSFWFSESSRSYLYKAGVSLTYICGNEKFTITSSQSSCGVSPSGSVESFGLSAIAIDFKVTPGHCASSHSPYRPTPAAPGFIMWKILPNQ